AESNELALDLGSNGAFSRPFLDSLRNGNSLRDAVMDARNALLAQLGDADRLKAQAALAVLDDPNATLAQKQAALNQIPSRPFHRFQIPTYVDPSGLGPGMPWKDPSKFPDQRKD